MDRKKEKLIRICAFCNNEELPIKELDVTWNKCVALIVVTDGKTNTSNVFRVFILPPPAPSPLSLMHFFYFVKYTYLMLKKNVQIIITSTLQVVFRQS